VLTRKDKHLASAQKFMERGQLERARDEYARVVLDDPSDTRTWLKLAEIHVRRGEIGDAREIYLRTAELYVAQGFVSKAVTVYKSVLKLTPGMPHVRERLADAYRQLGMVADALRELGLAADEHQQKGRAIDALPALRRIVGLHPDHVGSRVRLAETAFQAGAVDEAVHELRQAAAQLKQQGRIDEFVRVSERLLFHRPSDAAVARELAAAYIARKNPRQALAKLQGALKADSRDPANVALLAEAMAQLDPSKAISVYRELAEIHDAAGRIPERDAAVRSALALDPTDGETKELAAHWNVSAPAPTRGRASGLSQPSLPAVASALRAPPTASGVIETSVSGLSRGLSAISPAPADEVARILAEADVFVKYGLAERAVDHLRKVFAIEAHHRGARERLATVLDQLGRRSEAADELATLARQLADPAEAAVVAERALTLDPSCAAAAAMLGREPATQTHRVGEDLLADLDQVDFFMQQSLFDDARDVLDEMDHRFPRHPLLAEKRVALEAARAVAALPSDDTASDEHPGAIPTAARGELEAPVARLGAPVPGADPGTHGDLGIAYKQMGLYDAAIGEFTAMATDKRRTVFALTMIGECIEAKGDFGEAVAKYKQALNQPQVTPSESLELYYLLGGVFEQLGDIGEALYFFENLSKRDARFRDVGQRIATLKPKLQARRA
jgi:tetratricopeptide (TPR) repeat protein